jgi:SAM-dependent methyltransferase
MSGVHPTAWQGFTRSAAAYERARPDYPPAALDWLMARLGLRSGATVLDLASGTGKLTRPLLAAGLEVVAVEPVAEMRSALPAEATVLEGLAEEIPLAAGRVDAVTVAQAFHWFDGDAALQEIHRVLRPGGALGLVWNRRRMSDRLNQQIEELIGPHRRRVPAHSGGAWKEAFGRTRMFGPLEEKVFANEQVLDAAGLADRFGSVSFIATLDEAERTRVLDAVRALAADGPVTLRYDTEVHVAERRR